MRTITALLAVLCAIGFTACGDKADGTNSAGGGGAKVSGVVGSWTMDMPRFLADQTRQRMDAQAREASKSQVQSREAVLAEVTAMFGAGKFDMTIKADGTVSVLSQDPGEPVETTLGTWVQTGDQIVATPKTRDGKAVEGEDAKPKTMTWKGDVLEFHAGGDVVVYLKRA
jgi:hypothetical protein